MKKLILSALIMTFLFSCKKEFDDKHLNDNVDSLEVKNTSTDSLGLGKPYKKPIREVKAELAAKGFEFFDYIDEKTNDTIIMQQYFMVFLKSGPIRSQNEEETRLLQKEHLAHLAKMYELGYADISGPFADQGNIRGVSIYNVPTLKMADSLAKSDPMVEKGNLIVEVHPWWAAKGYALR
ncbi:YciI family protein [Confluentibacter citreus]|uniref:YciI family protein n=1 Tax=Confluentibacter citreus TaxID=2007307 RepID=UPI000C286FE2|nr:YciI family protein [Confluentibacter citreus]